MGKFLLGFYLGRASVGSAYGAAGSLVVLLVWIYYAAQIFFFGAELTRSYARRHGSLLSGIVADQAKLMPVAEASVPGPVPEPFSLQVTLLTDAKVPVSPVRRGFVKRSTKSEALTLVVAVVWIGVNWWRERQRRAK